MKLSIKAILFDLVGTLIYVKDSVGIVYANVAKSYGFNVDPKKIDISFQKAIHLNPQPAGGNEEEKKWWRDVVFNTFNLSGYDLTSKFNEVFEILFEIFSQESTWAIYPDALLVLNKLYEKTDNKSVKIGLISNFDNRLETILKGLNLLKYFNCLTYSGKVGFSKPDIRIFQSALNELNIIAEEAIYIGDSLNSDYYPAKEMNINTLLIDRGKMCMDRGVKTITDLNKVFDHLR